MKKQMANNIATGINVSTSFNAEELLLYVTALMVPPPEESLRVELRRGSLPFKAIMSFTASAKCNSPRKSKETNPGRVREVVKMGGLPG